MRKTFSISVEESVIAKVDELVERGRFGSRSQAIEYCMRQFVEMGGRNKEVLESLIDFLDLLAEDPGRMEKLRAYLEGCRASDL